MFSGKGVLISGLSTESIISAFAGIGVQLSSLGNVVLDNIYGYHDGLPVLIVVLYHLNGTLRIEVVQIVHFVRAGFQQAVSLVIDILILEVGTGSPSWQNGCRSTGIRANVGATGFAKVHVQLIERIVGSVFQSYSRIR